MNTDKRMYMILYPNPALVASQLEPSDFARHYISGSTRYYDGKVVFAEVDPAFRDPFFQIDHALEAVHAHEDGRPKATKFISVYRVLEHMDFSAINHVYLTTPEAVTLELQPEEHPQTREPGLLRIFAEITPLRMLVLTKHDFIHFGQSITDPHTLRWVPRIFYTQLEFDADEFIKEHERNPLMNQPLPGLHPSRLRDAIEELRASRDKSMKGLALDCSFDRIPYRTIRHGFMFASQDETRFFRMPDQREIQDNNYRFWKAM